MIKKLDQENLRLLNIKSNKIDTYYLIKVDNDYIIVNLTKCNFDDAYIAYIVRYNGKIDKPLKELEKIGKIYIYKYPNLELNDYNLTSNQENGIRYQVERYFCNNEEDINKPIMGLINKNIPPFDKTKIKTYNMNTHEFETFINTNYKNNDGMQLWLNNSSFPTLFGFEYTHIEWLTDNYLFCTIPNGEKEVIIGIISYKQDVEIDEKTEKATYISYVETNYFYRNKGICKYLLKTFLNEITTVNLITSDESKMGKIIGTHRMIEEMIKSNNKKIICISESELLRSTKKLKLKVEK